jgi:predicted Holliday junction resolvase-like endonuclease
VDDSALPVGAGNPSYDSLLQLCVSLRQRIVELELGSARAEENVRAELAAAHEEALQEMEETCQRRVDEAYAHAEEKVKKIKQIMMAQQQQQQQTSNKLLQMQPQPLASIGAPIGDKENLSTAHAGVAAKIRSALTARA